MGPRTAAAAPIVIRAAESGRNVLVTTADQDRFLLGVPQAIAACRMYDELMKKRAEFWEDLIPRLWEWLQDHRDRASCGYLAPRESGLLFIVICRNIFDSQFEDELTDLDMEIAQKFPRIALEVLELPEGDEHLSPFIDPRITPLKFDLKGRG